MSKYAWMITKDYLAEPTDEISGFKSEVGLIGPSDASDLQMNKLKAGLGYRFRMYDDDGELYYEGRIVFAPELEAGEVSHRMVAMTPGEPEISICCAGLPEEAFGPLDDFGKGNAGCTTIKYFDKHGRLGAL